MVVYKVINKTKPIRRQNYFVPYPSSLLMLKSPIYSECSAMQCSVKYIDFSNKVRAFSIPCIKRSSATSAAVSAASRGVQIVPTPSETTNNTALCGCCNAWGENGDRHGRLALFFLNRQQHFWPIESQYRQGY